MQASPPPSAVQRRDLGDRIRQTIEEAIAQETQSGGVTGAPVGTATTEPPWNPADIPPRAQEVAIASMFMLAAIIIGFPIARAIARRIDRMGVVPRVPAEVSSQLNQLNQAVESIAIEVERISEGQRFTTKLLSEQHKLPAADRNFS